MSVTRDVYVQCDKCHDRSERPAKTVKEAKKIAIHDGFRKVDGQDYCPDCWDKWVKEQRGYPGNEALRTTLGSP